VTQPTPHAVIVPCSCAHGKVRRRLTGASVVALMQQGEVVPNPSPTTVFGEGDLLGLIGTSEELAAVEDLLAGATPASA